MAKIDVQMPDEMMLKLSKLEKRTDSVITKILEAGGKVMLAEVRKFLSAVVGKNTKYISRSTGELQDALGLSGVKTDERGRYNIKVGFSEPRRNGESNKMIANILENGKHGQPAKPFLKPAKKAGRAACIDAMKRAFDEEVNKV